MDDLSLGRSVSLSSALWKNGGSDPDVVWHHRSDGSRVRQVVGFDDCSTRRGTFGGAFGARHCNQCNLYGIGLRQCLNRRSCSGLRHCCIRWGPMSCKGKGTFCGFCSLFSQWEMPLGHQRRKNVTIVQENFGLCSNVAGVTCIIHK